MELSHDNVSFFLLSARLFCVEWDGCCYSLVIDQYAFSLDKPVFVRFVPSSVLVKRMSRKASWLFCSSSIVNLMFSLVLFMVCKISFNTF